MKKDQTEQRVSRIIRLFFYSDYPQRLTEEVHGWLASEIHEKEKDMALREIWDEMIQPDNDPTEESYRETYRSYEKLTRRLGIPNVEKKPVMALRRTAAKIAAVLVPVAIVLGAYLIWSPSVGEDWVRSGITVETGEGQQRRVVLPDRSEVWLNSSSRLVYRSDFAEGRDVELTGEAFFSVRKSGGTPFTVRSGRMSVRVLGTEFNVQSYENAPATEVTLVSGIVEVSARRRTMVLEPGQTLTMDNRSSKMSVGEGGSLDWNPARLNFSDTPLSEVFRVIAVYYGVEVEVEGSIPSNRVTVNFRDNEEIENILYILQNTTQAFGYTLDGGKITIRAK